MCVIHSVKEDYVDVDDDDDDDDDNIHFRIRVRMHGSKKRTKSLLFE